MIILFWVGCLGIGDYFFELDSYLDSCYKFNHQNAAVSEMSGFIFPTYSLRTQNVPSIFFFRILRMVLAELDVTRRVINRKIIG